MEYNQGNQTTPHHASQGEKKGTNQTIIKN